MTQQSQLSRGGRYDVVIVGGGPAGLSGALMLGRARRSVLVIDSGQPRNAPAAHLQGFLSRDGVPPGHLLEAGRLEVAGYGSEIITGRARSAFRDDWGYSRAEHGGGFAVELDSGRTVRARRLLVTTGITDELPDIPGLTARWGRDVLHCPYCHGWEVRDQPIGVLATSPMSTHQALLFRQWTDKLTLLLHTGPRPTREEAEQFAARDIAVVAGEVRRSGDHRRPPHRCPPAHRPAGPAPGAGRDTPRRPTRGGASHARAGTHPAPARARCAHRRRREWSHLGTGCVGRGQPR
jgi:thioredoxin reductase